MSAVSESEAVTLFAQQMTPFIASCPATARLVLDAFVGFYRDVRVQGAGDSMMLEWGASRPHLLDEFTDLREVSPQWDETEYQWVGLTRQIRSDQGDDDTALCVFLYFDKAAGNEPSSNIEFEGVDELESQVGRFLKKSYVAQLLAAKPSRVTAFASEVG